jgi:hypothetical protein
VSGAAVFELGERIATALERIATALERFEPMEDEPAPGCPHPAEAIRDFGGNEEWECGACGFQSPGRLQALEAERVAAAVGQGC